MSEHAGHRSRIIEKLNTNALQEHELLEVLLFNAIPRRNTNDLAHRLLARFGSIKGVFDAGMDELKEVNGVGESLAAYLFCIGTFYKKYYVPQRKEYPEKYEADDFFCFARTYYGELPYEVLDFYFLNNTGSIIGRKRFTDMREHHVILDAAELSKALVKSGAKGVVAVHNHLIGNVDYSEYDDQATSKIQVVCSVQNVMFCDHLVVMGNGVYSYYQGGRMKQISSDYSLDNILKTEKGEE